MLTERTSNYRPVTWDVAKVFRDITARGWTLEKMAEMSGVTAQTLGNLRRYGKPTPTTMAKIAKALKQKIDRYIVEE